MSSDLTAADTLGAWKARWGINRMNYIVPPGLYAVGEPDAASPVVVTANYKMSYDLIRKALAGRNVWLLVLETYGINVWCAAGKGTFGTGELVNRIARTRLAEVVSHRRLILPILGAPGVSAHRVKKACGFEVAYATIRAADLPKYLDNGCRTTPEMRELTFSWYDRLVLVPVELVLVLKPSAVVVAMVGVATLLVADAAAAVTIVLAYLGAVFTGVALGPVLLPLLPTRSFAVKGAVAGLVYAACVFIGAGKGWEKPAAAAAFVAFPAIASFYTLNFTGCTTYTSRSGVKKEMRLALPVMGVALVVALALLAVAGLN